MTTQRLARVSVCIALLAALPLALVPPAAAAKYEMEQKDRREEKRKLLEKLRKDKAKIDLAVESTKTLIDRSRQRPYLADLYLRLAELYIEKSRVVYFIRREEAPDGSRSLEHLESHALKRDALEIYQRVLDNFPDFAHRDKVLFFMAHEHRELGEIEEMLSRYREILKSYKDSAYAPESYLLLGDHFFNAKDLEMARRHYEAVLSYGGSPAVAVARYKLGWCHINEADWKGAIRLFEQAVATPDAGREVEIDTYRKVDIKLESLIDMAFCYGEEYKDRTPEEAVAYFERFAWSRPVLTVALEKLAQRFYVKKKWQHSAHVYRKLSTLRNDPEKLLEYAGKVFDCVRAVGGFERADEDMALIVKALRRQQCSVHVPDDVKERNVKEFELYARDIATHLHQRAREESSPKAFRTAAAAYRQYLDFFAKSEVRDEMRRNFAEALFAGHEYLEAGKVYEKIAKAPGPREREKEEGLYGAVLSYYSALKEKDGLTAYGKVYARSGLRANGQEYAQAYPKSDKVANVLFNVAWVAYDEGKFNTAIEEFTRFVAAYPARTEARAAVHLVLDAYNLRADYPGLLRCGETFAQNSSLDPELRREVGDILKSARSKIVTPLAVAAAQNWEKGKGGLLAFAEENRSSSLGDQALTAVVAASANARDLKTLFSAGTELVKRLGAANVSALEQPLNLLIDTCVRAAQFRQLAPLLEEFARHFPTHRAGPEFLLKAAQLREALGQRDLASADYGVLLARMAKDAPERADVLFQAVGNALKRSDRAEALRLLTADYRGLKGSERIRACARMAVIELAAGSPATAEPHAQEARKLAAATTPDPSARDALAEMELARIEPLRKEYAALHLSGAVLEKAVKRKGDLLTSLVEGYDEIIRLAAPKWSLAACSRAAEVHEEFARFLQEASAPADYTVAEKAEYDSAVEERASEYRTKGQEYRALVTQFGRSWELCDPELGGWLAADGKFPGGFGPSPLGASGEASERWLQDDRLVAAHRRLLDGPANAEGLLRLVRLYLELGDPRQAALVALKGVDEVGDLGPKDQAALWNAVGVARLNEGLDSQARDAFRKALAADPGHIAARVNLAGLLRHYGHREKADALYAELGAPERLAEDAGLVHSHAKELYDAAFQHARNP